MPDGEYTIRVTATDNGEEGLTASDATDDVTVAKKIVPPSFDKPSNVTATQKNEDVTSITAELSWTGVTADWVDGYEIQHSIDGGKTWTFWMNNGKTVTETNSVEIANLAAGDNQFRVRAVEVDHGNIVKTSDWSEIDKITMIASGATTIAKPKKVTVGKKQQNEAPTVSTITAGMTGILETLQSS